MSHHRRGPPQPPTVPHTPQHAINYSAVNFICRFTLLACSQRCAGRSGGGGYFSANDPPGGQMAQSSESLAVTQGRAEVVGGQIATEHEHCDMLPRRTNKALYLLSIFAWLVLQDNGHFWLLAGVFLWENTVVSECSPLEQNLPDYYVVPLRSMTHSSETNTEFSLGKHRFFCKINKAVWLRQDFDTPLLFFCVMQLYREDVKLWNMIEPF